MHVKLQRRPRLRISKPHTYQINCFKRLSKELGYLKQAADDIENHLYTDTTPKNKEPIMWLKITKWIKRQRAPDAIELFSGISYLQKIQQPE